MSDNVRVAVLFGFGIADKNDTLLGGHNPACRDTNLSKESFMKVKKHIFSTDITK